MNLMGKIFTLLIFFMSICFLVIALMVGATHRNWKEIATQKTSEAALNLNRLNEAKSSTSDKEKLLAAERASRAMQLAQLESQLKVLAELKDSKESELSAIQEQSQRQLIELEEAQKRISDQDKEVADLRANNKKLVDDIATQFSLVRNLTNQSFEIKKSDRVA
jgi:vacuolar-type H+-ATPase subunit I/STV1